MIFDNASGYKAFSQDSGIWLRCDGESSLAGRCGRMGLGFVCAESVSR